MRDRLPIGLLALLLVVSSCQRQIGAQHIPDPESVESILVYTHMPSREHPDYVIRDRTTIDKTLRLAETSLGEWYTPWPGQHEGGLRAVVRFNDKKGRTKFVLWLGDDWVDGDDEIVDSGRINRVRVNEGEFTKLRQLLRLGE